MEIEIFYFICQNTPANAIMSISVGVDGVMKIWVLSNARELESYQMESTVEATPLIPQVFEMIHNSSVCWHGRESHGS